VQYYLEKERFEVVETPTFCVPVIVITRTGTGVHHEIDATASTKQSARCNSVGTSSNMWTRLRNIKVCSLTVWFEMMNVEGRCPDERVIVIISSRFDDQNLQSREPSGKSACSDTSCRAAYISL
jgi:hypothetical protein